MNESSFCKRKFSTSAASCKRFHTVREICSYCSSYQIFYEDDFFLRGGQYGSPRLAALLRHPWEAQYRMHAGQAAMDLEVEDINAHLTRLDGEKMLSTLKHYKVPLPEDGSADQLHVAAAGTSLAAVTAGPTAAMLPQDAPKEQ